MNYESPEITPSRAQGFERFEVLTWRPKPNYVKALLGKMILGAVALPDAAIRPEFSNLGDMYLGYAILGKEPQFYSWQKLTHAVQSIHYQRGVEASIFAAHGQLGTVTINIYNDFDPRAAYLYRGTPICVIDRFLQKTLFIGEISKATLTPAKNGTYAVSIDAVDAIAKLAAVKKYQETHYYARQWHDVVRVLLDGFEFNIGTKIAAPTIANIVKEASLAEYLDIVSNTAGIYWYCDNNGVIQFLAALPTTSSAMLVGDYELPGRNKLYLTDIDAGFDTSQLTSIVRVDNMQGAKNDEGEWQQNSTQHVIESAQKIEQYGRNEVSFETAAAEIVQLKTRLANKMNAETPVQTVSKAGVSLDIDTPDYEAIMTQALQLDLFDRVTTTFRNAQEEALIASVDCEITPYTLKITYGLIQARS